MSDSDRFDELAARLDAIAQDIRKQGRASVAAQAAAESCLEGVRALHEQLPSGAATSGPEHEQLERETVLRVLRALLPFADALDRAVEQASAAARVRPATSWLSRWLRRAAEPSADLAALATGLSLLQQQLRSTLNELDVDIESRIGIAVDGRIHRVVEARPAAETPPDTVIAVVRPGYSVGGLRLREAEVVASSRGPAGLPGARRTED